VSRHDKLSRTRWICASLHPCVGTWRCVTRILHSLSDWAHRPATPTARWDAGTSRRCDSDFTIFVSKNEVDDDELELLLLLLRPPFGLSAVSSLEGFDATDSVFAGGAGGSIFCSDEDEDHARHVEEEQLGDTAKDTSSLWFHGSKSVPPAPAISVTLFFHINRHSHFRELQRTLCR
jgi:hypothetical protein